MKNNLLVALIVYLIVGAFATFIGTIEQQYESERATCYDKKIRIELIFPFHSLGCWLGERVD